MWSRALAGMVPGFFLAAALVGLVTWLLPGPWQATLVPGMVAFVPVWTAITASAFAFRDGRHAWTWLGAAAVTATVALMALRTAGWIQ